MRLNIGCSADRIYAASCLWIIARGRQPNVKSIQSFLRSNAYTEVRREPIEMFLAVHASEITGAILRAQNEDAREAQASSEWLAQELAKP